MLSSEDNFKQYLFSDDVEDDVIEQEINESESYVDKWRVLSWKLEQLLLLERDEILGTSSSVGATKRDTLLRYPKILLPSFNGDLRSWMGFWGQFEKVDGDPCLDLHDKFTYLSQCMEKGSIAEEVINSFPPGGNSYQKAIECLKMRFGLEELLIQVYVRDLLSIVLQKQNKPRKSLRSLYDLLKTKLRALETLGVTRDKYASMLFPLVESALPEETLLAWERFRSTSRRSREEGEHNASRGSQRTDLDLILEFLQDEVRAEEHIVLASQNFIAENKYSVKVAREKKQENSRHRQWNVHEVASATDLLTTSREQRQCIFCNSLHKPTDCLKVRKMKVEDRQRLVERSRCCFLCLKPGHQARKCFSKVTCVNCGRRHQTLLCRSVRYVSFQQAPSISRRENVELDSSTKQDHALANVSQSPMVMLPTLTVLIRGNGRTRKARAIIDTASQRSYILKNTAQKMNYRKEGCEYLQHSLFGGENTGVCKHDEFTLYLTSLDRSYNCHFQVLSQPLICKSVPPTVPVPHLEELSKCNILVNDDFKGPIEVLIGADVAGKIITGGCKSLSNGLTAMETRLGWIVMGKIPKMSTVGNVVSVASSVMSTAKTVEWKREGVI